MDWTVVVHTYSLMMIMMAMFIPIVVMILMMRGVVRVGRFATKRRKK